MLHACILSITSATGQLFIYYTISQFGPVTFIIIMTIRMGECNHICLFLEFKFLTVCGVASSIEYMCWSGSYNRIGLAKVCYGSLFASANAFLFCYSVEHCILLKACDK